jgi:hypothetical protein
LGDLPEIRANYQDFNRAMAEGVYVVPAWYVTWTIGSQTDVELGVVPLPDGRGKPQFISRLSLLGLRKG